MSLCTTYSGRHFIPAPRTYSVPLFLKRQRDRTLGDLRCLPERSARSVPEGRAPLLLAIRGPRSSSWGPWSIHDCHVNRNLGQPCTRFASCQSPWEYFSCAPDNILRGTNREHRRQVRERGLRLRSGAARRRRAARADPSAIDCAINNKRFLPKKTPISLSVRLADWNRPKPRLVRVFRLHVVRRV